MLEKNNLLQLAIDASIDAGIATLKYYGKEFDVNLKSDDSPLTQADLDSNNIIEKRLLSTNIPILSEESIPEKYTERKKWSMLWIVDPLDGTKEFIKKSNEYTINIALVENGAPIMGVVYAPALDTLYYGDQKNGAFKVLRASKLETADCTNKKFRIKLQAQSQSSETIVVASKSHRNDETNAFLSKLSDRVEGIKVESYGSSLKLCMIAEGKADIYPRLGPTMEWDTAASHAVVISSGAEIKQYPSFKNVVYNKEDLLNPYFIVYQKSKEKAVKSI